MSRPACDASSDDILDYVPVLRAFAWSLCRRHEDVDDLVQETLLKALANRHRYQDGTNMRAWMFTIMRNTFYRSAHKAARERPGSGECASGCLSVPATQDWSLRGSEVWNIVLHLPPQYREALILVVMLGESYEDAANICGVAIGTIKSRINRARGQVMERLGETQV